MGFGSYDGSEQQAQTVETDETDAVDVLEHDYDGKIHFQTDASTDSLIDRLSEIKDNDDAASNGEH